MKSVQKLTVIKNNQLLGFGNHLRLFDKVFYNHLEIFLDNLLLFLNLQNTLYQVFQ